MDYRLSLLFAVLTLSDSGQSASIDVPPLNTSALLGETAEFFCGVSGTQEGGESLLWTKLPNFFISQDDVSVNTTKFQITDKYRLHILDAIPKDSGEYQCQIMAEMYSAWLTVCDPPVSVEITWEGEGRDIGTDGNLTCTCPRSLPPATLRWFKGSEDVTDEAASWQQVVDGEGYGESVSYLNVTITEENYDVTYRCQASVPAVEDATFDEFSFSTASCFTLTYSTLFVLTLIAFS